MDRAAPLETEEKACNPGNEEDSSGNIKLRKELTGRRAGCVRVGREVDQEDDHDGCDATEGKVDPKTPSYSFSKPITRKKGQTHSNSADPSKHLRESVRRVGRCLQPRLRRQYTLAVCP